MANLQIDYDDQWLFANANKIAEYLDHKLKPAQFSARPINKAGLQGKFNSHKHGAGSDFWQFRPYIMGDAQKNIAWRKSAKTDKIIIKEFEDKKPLSIQFWCDNSAAMNWRAKNDAPTKAMYAQLLAFSIIRYLKNNFENVALLGPKQISPKNSISISNLKKYGLYLPNNFASGCALIFTDGLEEIEYYKKIVDLGRKANCRIIFTIIQDQNEKELNYTGRALFQTNANDEAPFLINDCEQIKEKFQAKYNLHFYTLKQLIEANNHDYIEALNSDDAAAKSLAICTALMKSHAASANL